MLNLGMLAIKKELLLGAVAKHPVIENITTS